MGCIVEPDVGETNTLKLYMLLRVEDLGRPKAGRLAALDLGGLKLKPLPWRFESAASIGAFTLGLPVGIHHITTRRVAQQADPRYLGIGATTYWSAIASCNRP